MVFRPVRAMVKSAGPGLIVQEAMYGFIMALIFVTATRIGVFGDISATRLLAMIFGMNITWGAIDMIVFYLIDEGEHFVTSKEFAEAIQNSDNYYVIATRSSLFNLSYSVNEVYGIRNISGNKYQGTKKLYSEFYPLHKNRVYESEIVLYARSFLLKIK